MIRTKQIITLIFLSLITILNAQEKKTIDGVIAVVGKHIILESDIDNFLLEAEVKGGDTSGLTRCNILGNLLENKMFAHHAVEDSLTVTDAEIKNIIDGQIDRMVEQRGSLAEVVKSYGKSTIQELKKDLSKIIRTNKLASMKQGEIAKGIEITPQEVRTFYNKIPKDELPMVEELFELSEITIEPEVKSEEVQAVIDKLNKIKQDIKEGYSFSSQATLYTEDPGSIKTGGFYQMDKKTPFVKEFKDIAFSLKEGEISSPFKTDFGYHIIYLEKINGPKLDIRHILISPKPSEEELIKANEKINKLRERILNKEITFSDAARMYSSSKNSKGSGGLIQMNEYGETRIPSASLIQNSEMYYAVNNLQEKEISQPFVSQSSGRKKVFKIIELTNKIDAHKADFEIDFMEIKQQALLDKQRKAIQKWINKKVVDTHVFIGEKYKNCEFSSNWLKK